MRLLLIFLTLALTATTSFAKIYTWKDASGRTVYGDNPPQQNKAKEVLTQELTIVPGFKDPSLEQNKVNQAAEGNPDASNTDNTNDESSNYESFNITYPTNDLSIRSNSGNITSSFELTPGLKKSDTLFIYLDGKKVVEDSKSLSASFSNLDRGSHSMFAVIRNHNGDVLINSNTVTFHVLRNSIIINRRR